MKYILFLIAIISLKVSAQDYKKFETDYGVLAYKTFGEGFPVLIINGGPGMNSKGFEALAEMLSENNTTIIYDHRGTGSSKMNRLVSSEITIDLMVEDMESLRKELGYDQWILLGHSFGGNAFKLIRFRTVFFQKFPDRC